MRSKRVVGLLVLGAVLALGGCGRDSDGGPAAGAGGGIAVTGTVVGTPARVGARGAFAAPAGDLAVVLVDGAGAEVDSGVVSAGQPDFALVAQPGRDYALLFRQGGRTVAVLVADDATGRTAFSLAQEDDDVALGDVALDRGRGRARALAGASLRAPAGGSPMASDDDRDGIPNPADRSRDEDSDGVGDLDDRFPFDEAEFEDTDDDGVGNNADLDDDDDGVADAEDLFPRDPSESGDRDGDGIGDSLDPDADGDGVLNTGDAFPLNPAEFADADRDGIGDNADLDDDNDGVADLADAFPLNPAESADSDGDGIGDNADLDDDGDGVADASDGAPLDPARFAVFNPPVALGGLGAAPAAASAINDFGQVVGNAQPGPGQAAQAVVWSVDMAGIPAGSAVALQGLPGGGAYSLANGNDNADRIVGEAVTAGGDTVAVLWKTPDGVPGKLPPLPAFAQPGALDNARSAAFDINDAGLIVGQAETASFDVHPAAWLLRPDGTVDGAKDLQVDKGTFAGTPFGRANAVSESGLVVGEIQIPVTARRDAGETHAVLWRLNGLNVVAGPIDLGTLPGDADSTALSVNDAGVVVGESVSSSGDTHAVRWTVNPATLAVTGPIDLGAGAEASSVNRSGRIAGAVTRAGRSETASVWDLATLSPAESDDVNPAAGGSNRAVGLNGLGQVVGIRSLEAFVATPR